MNESNRIEFNFSGFVKTPSDVYIKYRPSRSPRAGTLIFLNGLGESSESWMPIAKHLAGENYGLMFVDLHGQGQTLENEIDSRSNFEISVQEQALSLREVIRLSAPSLPLQIIGYSYGGGVALQTYANYASTGDESAIDKLILIAPFIKRLDLAHPIQRVWARQFNLWKRVGGVVPRVFERQYDSILTHYMHQRFAGRIGDERLRQVAIELTKGIMPFDGFPILERLTTRKLHLVTMLQDTLIPNALFEEVWERVPELARSSWLQVEDSDHLIQENGPDLIGQWILYLLRNSHLNGSLFRANIRESTISDGFGRAIG